MKWTKEQQAAIDVRNRDVLVSAAAGSGKTAVLVERIIQILLDEEKKVDIDRLLVVTFTNAAAEEMRSRIGRALEQALAHDPASAHLKKQVSLMQKAPISTLHSFCLDLIRQYTYLLDIDPAFRIADQMEADLLKQDVIDQLFESWYSEEAEEREIFLHVIDRFSTDRSDEAVETLMMALYHYAITNPNPIEWLQSLHEVYDVDPAATSQDDLLWLQPVQEDLTMHLHAIIDEIKRAEAVARESGGPEHYLEAIDSDLKQLQEALGKVNNWNNLQQYMQQFKFKALSRKQFECDEALKDKVKDIRKKYKESIEKLVKQWFLRDLSSHLADMQELGPVVKHLGGMVVQFIEKFNEEKRARALVDFSDLEHLCLQLLRTEDSHVPSEVAESLRNHYYEVLIDEYQDTNLVQETILNFVRNPEGNGNLFMVGDVKQSIYRFRHAEPALFIEKHKAFLDESHSAARIDLASNFRSREAVLTGTNFIFRQILDETFGEIAYDEAAELIYANKIYEDMAYPKPEAELIVIDRDKDEVPESVDSEESFLDLEKAQIEARMYAQKIKEWLGEPLQVGDKSTGEQRDIQYRDIVILQRSMTWTATIVDELKKANIPVYAELTTGYFEAIEIKVMLSYLKIIDNPYQDIPLASVLKSPIVQLDEEELAQIRLKERYKSYYEAVQTYVKTETNELSQKLERFLDRLETFRLQARQGALSELIWRIYRETGFYDFVGGMPGGRQRTANLRALYDRARGYEKTSFRGLYRFLRFIERIEERGDDLGSARALSEQEDVVRIMTIHKSKGLEFPVVIVGGIARQFNVQDLRKRYSVHKDLGFATKYIDSEKRIMYPTLFYQAVNLANEKEMLAEEMRVLYVALTRAKEKLVLIGNVDSLEKNKENWQRNLEETDWILPIYERASAKSYIDWIGASIIRHQAASALWGEENPVENEIYHDSSEWKVHMLHASELIEDETVSVEESTGLLTKIKNWEPVNSEEQWDAVVESRLSFTYPQRLATEARAKQSVTEVKRQHELRDEFGSTQVTQGFQQPISKRPLFMQKEKEYTAPEIGTALHTVMQHISFKDMTSKEHVTDLVDDLVQKEILEESLSKEIKINEIMRFLKTDLVKQLGDSRELFREVPFNLAMRASEVYEDWKKEGLSEEQIFLQGIIDCVARTEEGLIILDYKTDYVPENITDQVREKLVKRYEIQLNLYRYAVEKIWGERVEKTYLYFFDQDLLLVVNRKESTI